VTIYKSVRLLVEVISSPVPYQIFSKKSDPLWTDADNHIFLL